MKILYHHRTLGDGAEGIHIESMIQAFRKLGHEVRVISLMPTGSGPGQESGRRIGRLVKRLPRALYELAEMAYNLKATPEVVRAIRDFRPDLVYERYNLYNDCVGTARALGIPAFLEVNTPYAYQRRVYERLSYPKLAAWTEARTWRRADRVLVVSSPLKRYVMEAGVPEERIDILPNGVDLELFDIRRHSGTNSRAANGPVSVGFVGSLRSWHGMDLLLEAVEPMLKSGEARLVVVGEGPELPTLEQRVRSEGLEGAVRFRGNVPHEGIPSVLAELHIAVSPRNVFYQSPMKILEYMAMGCAVVAPDAENIRDLVDQEREAILFRRDDVGSLREALRRLIHDEALRRRLGEAARQRVQRRHTWIGNARHVVGRWEEFRNRVSGR